MDKNIHVAIEAAMTALKDAVAIKNRFAFVSCSGSIPRSIFLLEDLLIAPTHGSYQVFPFPDLGMC